MIALLLLSVHALFVAADDTTELLTALSLPSPSASDMVAGAMLDMPMNDEDTGGVAEDSLDPSISELRLNMSCSQLRRPCGDGFVCVPQLDGDLQPLAPQIASAAFLDKLRDIDDRGKLIALACIARRSALRKAVVHTAVGASFALRLSVLLVAEATAAKVNAFLVLTKLGLLSVGAGVINVGQELNCTRVFDSVTCDTIEKLKQLDVARKAAKEAGRPEPLLDVPIEKLKQFLNEDVSPAEDDATSTLADDKADGNPYKTDSNVVNLFKDIKKLSTAVVAAKIANDKLNANERDPSLIGALIARRQLVKLGIYAVSLRAFNIKAKAFLDADFNTLKSKFDQLPDCAGAAASSVECKDAKYALLKTILQEAGVATEIVKAAVVIELAKIRGAFVWKYLTLASIRVKQLWWGTIKCAIFFKKNSDALKKIREIVDDQMKEQKPIEDKLKKLRDEWDKAQKLLDKVGAGKTPKDLSESDKKNLVDAFVKISETRAEVEEAMAKWAVKTAGRVARRVFCRRRLSKSIKFSLRAVCRAQDDEGACRDKVENYFNGIKQKVIDNKDKLKALYDKYNAVKGCWPLIRFQIASRVIAGAFVAAKSNATDQTLVDIDAVSSDPCAAVDPSDGACQEVSGTLIVPAVCEATTAPTSGDATADTAAQAMTTSTSGMRRRAVLAADEAMTNNLLDVLTIDSGSSFVAQPDPSVDPMAKDFSVATDAALADAPTCASLGLTGLVECNNIKSKVGTTMRTSEAASTTASTVFALMVAFCVALL